MLMHNWSDVRSANYQAFWIVDKGMDTPRRHDLYTPGDYLARMMTQHHEITIWTEPDSIGFFCIEVYDSEPDFAPVIWDHIVEASIYLPTGGFQVEAGAMGVFTEYQVAPGWHRVRSFHSINHLAAYNNYYKITVWPAPFSPLKVVKHYSPLNLSESIYSRTVEVLIRWLAGANDVRLNLTHYRRYLKGPGFVGLHTLFYEAALDVRRYYSAVLERFVMLGGNCQRITHKDRSLSIFDGEYVQAMAQALAVFSVITHRASDEAYVIGDKDTVDLLAYISGNIDKWRSQVEAQGQASH